MAELTITRRDLASTAILAGVFVVTMLLAVLFARPFQDAGLQAFEDPQNVGNSIGYILLLLAFTFLILWIARKGKKWIIRVIILTAIASTIVYVVPPLLLTVGVPAAAAWASGVVVGGACAIALYTHPEWYVIDVVGVLVAAGAASIFGISLGILPVVVLLAALAVYDALAVYKTKHMLALADSVMELRLPVLLVIPKTGKYRFRSEVARFKEAAEAHDETEKEAAERDALFMGLGDLVMPTILVVSALVFGSGATAAAGAAAGTLVGFAVLMSFVLKGRPQAGLPLLNGGALVGFVAGTYATTGSLVFW